MTTQIDQWSAGRGFLQPSHLIILTALLTGCHLTATRDWSKAKLPIPTQYSSKPISTATAPQQKLSSPLAQAPWWQAFQSSEFNQLAKKALEQNLSLEQMAARVKIAKAQALAANSALLPQLNSQASKFDFNGARGFLGGGNAAPGGGVGGQVSGQLGTLYSSTTTLNYELDLWGRLFSQSSSATLNYQATQADLESLALTTTALLFEHWLNLTEAKARVDLIKAQIVTNQQQLQLLELRAAQGLTSLLTVLQQRQQLIGVESELPTAQRDQELACANIQAILGQSIEPQNCSSSTLPPLPDLPGMPVPADLLINRPDLKAALLRVQAADYDLAASLASFLPSARLSLSWQYNAAALSDLFESSFRNILQSFDIPWFDGGRRLAQRNSAAARLAELSAAYHQTLLTALFEVESALTGEYHARESLRIVESQLAAAQATSEVATRRYLEGAASYLDVIIATDAAQRTERRLLSEQKQLLLTRSRLYRALGGSLNYLNKHTSQQRSSLDLFFQNKQHEDH